MADSEPTKLSVEEQVARIKAAKEAAKLQAAEKAAAKAAAAELAAAVPATAPVSVVVPVQAPAPAPVHIPVPTPAPVVAVSAPAAVPVAEPVAATPATPAVLAATPAPGSVEEKVAQIKAAKAAAAEKNRLEAAAKAGGAPATAPAAAPAPGSVEEKVAQIKAAKAAAAEKNRLEVLAKAGGSVAPAAAAPIAAGIPPAPGSVEEKVAQIKAAKAAAAEKGKADAAAKAGVAHVTQPSVAPKEPFIAVETSTGVQPVPPGTPEALAKAAAAHEKAQGATGINAHGAPANRPAVTLLAAAARKPVAATAVAKKKDPELPLPPPPQLAQRRAALGFITLGTGAWIFFWGWLAAVGGLFTRFMFPNVLYESDPKFNAGRKNDFPESPKVYEKYKQDQAVWIVRLTEEGQDRLVALSTVCTHLGCTPNWLEVEQKYKCPCHGSGYYMNGVNFEGPTPRPLERFKIYVDATGNIIVDKAKKYRQDLQQWNENQSYVSMG